MSRETITTGGDRHVAGPCGSKESREEEATGPAVATSITRINDAVEQVASVADDTSPATQEVSASAQQSAASSDHIASSSEDLAGRPTTWRPWSHASSSLAR